MYPENLVCLRLGEALNQVAQLLGESSNHHQHLQVLGPSFETRRASPAQAGASRPKFQVVDLEETEVSPSRQRQACCFGSPLEERSSPPTSEREIRYQQMVLDSSLRPSI